MKGKLLCPVCKHDYNHLVGVPYQGSEGAQGSWHIPFQCEGEGHEFNVVFSEHKGQIFTWVEDAKMYPLTVQL